MKRGIYVGSFNPVHKGHIKIVNYVLEKYLDKVIMIATGNYWDKTDLASIKDRINMLKLYENERIMVEEEINELPYTYLVMEHFRDKYKDDELYLIIGADNIVSFDKWKNYEELLKYNLIVVKRDNIDIEFYLEKLNKKDKIFITDKLENIDISSTDIRNMILNKEFTKMTTMIDVEIINYIDENKLYI